MRHEDEAIERMHEPKQIQRGLAPAVASRADRDARDREILDTVADRLNEEMAAAMEHQDSQ